MKPAARKNSSTSGLSHAPPQTKYCSPPNCRCTFGKTSSLASEREQRDGKRHGLARPLLVGFARPPPAISFFSYGPPPRERAAAPVSPPPPYLLQNARHRAHDLGPVQLEQFLQIVRISIGDGHALMEVAIAERPLEHVRQRQHGERLTRRLREHPPQAGAQIEDQVAVREHDTPWGRPWFRRYRQWSPGSAGRWPALRCVRAPPPGRRRRASRLTMRGREVPTPGVSSILTTVRSSGNSGSRGCRTSHLRCAADQRHPAAAVPQQVGDLRRRQRIVNRHHHQPGQQDGKIGDMPLRPIFGKHRHPIAFCQAGRQQIAAAARKRTAQNAPWTMPSRPAGERSESSAAGRSGNDPGDGRRGDSA